METIKKVFIGQVRAINEEKFTVDTVMSDETVDRYKEIIFADAYKKRLKGFMKHPVLLTSHSYKNLTSQIGEWEKVWVEEDQLIGRAKYYVGKGNPEADWGFFLAQQGVAAYSVGFISHSAESDPEKIQEMLKERGKGGKELPYRVYTDVELLECSQVLVPANPSALQNSMEEFKKRSVDEKGTPVPVLIEDSAVYDLSKSVLDKLENDDVFAKKAAEFDEEMREEELEDIETKPQSPTSKFFHIAAPGQEGKHTGHNITTLTLSASKGIKSHYCVDDKTTTGYMFDKKKWTLAKAQKWVKDHHKAIEFIDVSEAVFTTDELFTSEGEGYEGREFCFINMEEINDEFETEKELLKEKEADMDQKVFDLMLEMKDEIAKLGEKVATLCLIEETTTVVDPVAEDLAGKVDLYGKIIEDKTGDEKLLEAIRSLTSEINKKE